MSTPSAGGHPNAAARPRAARRAGARSIIIGVAVGAVIATALPGAPTAPLRSDTGAPAHALPTPPAMQQALGEFQRHALNLLLLPLVDDSTPPRWQAFGIDWVCRGVGEVSVDGHPLIDGAPLPADPFVLRWTLHRCPPLGSLDFLVDGVVTMTVSRVDGELQAVVDARLSTFDGIGERNTTGPFGNAQPRQFAETR